MKRLAVISSLASLAGLLLWMAGCQGCVCVPPPEGDAWIESAIVAP